MEGVKIHIFAYYEITHWPILLKIVGNERSRLFLPCNKHFIARLENTRAYGTRVFLTVQ